MEARRIGHQRVAALVQPAPAGAPIHLQQLIGLDMPLDVAGHVARVGHGHRAHGEIDARGETSRRHHGAQVAALRQGLDHARPQRVAEPAVVKRHARPQQPCQLRARQRLLLA